MSKRARSDSEGEPRTASPPAATPDVSKSLTESLIDLLDMTKVQPGTEPAHFEAIAKMLMQNFHICAASKADPPVISAYELLEIEFYWYSPGTGHVDPFTHAAEEQRVGGNWYFHRAPRRVGPGSQSTAPVPSPKTSGFKGGSRKGLDLTFGIPPPPVATNSSDPPASAPVAYGGILLRALRHTTSQKVTAGPSLLVDELLGAIGTDSLTDLVGTLWQGNTRAFLNPDGPGPRPSRMFLRQADKPKVSTIYTSPRIGLELSRIATPAEATPNHPRVQYVIRPYRFFTNPSLLGTLRPQTFYGLFSKHEAGEMTRAQIIDVLRMKPTQVGTLSGYLEEGRKVGRAGIKEFVSEQGKGAAPSVQRFLKMAGVLEFVLGKDLAKDEGSAPKKQKVAKTLSAFFAGPSKK